MITGIHHISLLISSEKSLEFYKILGFEEVYRKERANDTVVILEGFGIQLEVFADTRHPKRVVDITEPLGPRHFALKTDDIETEIGRLEEKFKTELGFEPIFEKVRPDWTGVKYAFFKDSDGNTIELHE